MSDCMILPTVSEESVDISSENTPLAPTVLLPASEKQTDTNLVLASLPEVEAFMSTESEMDSAGLVISCQSTASTMAEEFPHLSLHTPQSIGQKSTIIKVASLDCNSLAKISDPKKHSDLIQHLCSQDAHILALQETHASTPFLQSQLLSLFCAHSSFWIYSCVILERIPIPEDDKAILAQVSHA
ncbi:hypothetical protein BDF14DRAFT_1775099, partial [Spinellus fusiger]